MAVEQHNHFGELWRWVVVQWPVFLFVVGTLAGSVWWALHRVFVTHDRLGICKADLVTIIHDHEQREELHASAHAAENKREHHELKQDIERVRAEISSLKSLMIQIANNQHHD